MYSQPPVSSGEVNWHGIREGRFGSRFKPGARVHVVGRPGDDYGLQGLDLTLVEHPEAAEFILIAGSDAPRIGMDRYQAQLAPAVQAGVPALCANPDKLMLTARGLQPAPGAIAEVYQQLGGIVTYTGKPYPDIYRFALALVAGTDPARVLAIGDSIEHDIAGAARMGLRSALIRKGILADLDDAGLARLYEQHRATPDFILERFVW